MRIAAAKLGRLGELCCVLYYLLRGYRVVARNVRLRAGEIDLVVRRGATLVVAEVKTRQSLAAGEGHEAVNREKRMRLVRLADQFLASTGRSASVRFDVLSLYWTGWRFVVSYYPDAFRPVGDPRQPWKWRA